MLRPSPVPLPTSLVVKNGSKILLVVSSLMPGPTVHDLDVDASAVGSRAHGDVALVGDRLDGVGQQVEEDLADLAGVALHRRNVAVLAVDVDPALEFALQQAQRLVDAFVQIGRLVGRCAGREKVRRSWTMRAARRAPSLQIAAFSSRSAKRSSASISSRSDARVGDTVGPDTRCAFDDRL